MKAARPCRAFQWDLARQAERLDWLLAQLPRYAGWGYEELYLHLEDAVEYPSLPGVARRGAYSHRDLGRLVARAGKVGIRVVPIVNLLGHTQYLLNDPTLRDLNELRAADGRPLARGQISPLHPRTLAVADKLLRDVAGFCTAGKVHVGLDESYHLGRHPRSQAEIARIGLAGHFARYVGRLHGLAAARGLRLGLWADMLALLPTAVPLLPRGVIAYDWYYYPFRRKPRIELRNFAEYDLAPALRARGIAYWGCPMNGAFRHEPLPIVGERLANIVSWWRRCRATGAAGMLVTSWEPQRLAAEIPQLVDAAAAGLWLEGEEDPQRLLAAGCRRLWGRAGRAAPPALAVTDAHPFSGYSRWQINDRWDTVVGTESLAAASAERKALARLARRPGLPPSLAASARFRAFVAERDYFVRQAGQAVWRLRAARGDRARTTLLREQERKAAEFARALVSGRKAAQAMWRRTRPARITSDNEAILASDRLRLAAWRAWLRRVRGRPGAAALASPVAGAWQLLVRVRNFAPAAQRIVLERREADQPWREVHGLFLIEFQARATRSRAALETWFSAPLDWAGPSAPFPTLRIAARGFGRFGIGPVLLTDGVRHFSTGKTRTVLGANAPARGYPDFDWRQNRGTAPLRLSARSPAGPVRTRSGARSS